MVKQPTLKSGMQRNRHRQPKDRKEGRRFVFRHPLAGAPLPPVPYGTALCAMADAHWSLERMRNDVRCASCRHVHAPAPGHSPHPQATAHDTGQPRAASGLSPASCLAPGVESWGPGVRPAASSTVVGFRLQNCTEQLAIYIGAICADSTVDRNKKPLDTNVRVKVTTVEYYK